MTIKAEVKTMALKNLFDMVKADRYTADGREALIKAQEAETEDKVYQIGEISQKTGLQKTANGWVKPKNGKQPGAASKHDTDPQTYIVKKNDELRKMYLNEKDPAKKEAMKKALKKQASMMEPEPFSSTGSKPDAADQRDQIGGEIKGNLEAAKYYFDKAQSFSPTDPSYKTYMTKAKQYNDEAKAQADDNGFDFEEMHNSGITQAVNKYAEEQSKPDKVGDFLKAYERGDFGKYQQNAEQRKAESFFKQNKDAAPSLSEIVDRVYNIGEISEKTGLQKTANGWVKPKKGAAGKTSRASKEEAIRKDLGLTAGEDMSRFTDEQIETMYAKTQQTPEQQKADFDKSKIGQAVNKGRQEFAAEKTRQKELASKTNAIGLPKENKPGAGIPTYKESDFIGKTYGDFAKTLPRGQYTITRNQENPDGSSENDFTDIKHGGKKITVKFDKNGKITSVKQHENPTRSYQVGASNQATETKPAAENKTVEKFDIEKWKTGPKVEKNSKLDWSHGVVGKSIPVQGKSAEEKRNLINKYNSVGRLSRIGTKKNSYYNNKYGTFEVAGIDNDNVYIQEERSNGMGSRYMALVTIPLNEVEEINPFHDYGKRNPDTGEESPTRPPLPEDSAPRQLTGDCRIRIRKEKPALTGDTKIRVRK
jgi:hypothetical protein